MTATLGTVSLALSGNISIQCDGNPCDDTPLIFLICVAVTEQFTGYAWNSIESFKTVDTEYKNSVYRNWFTTALCQAAEFYVLTLYKGTSPPWMAYTITWSLFGIWAALRVPIDCSRTRPRAVPRPRVSPARLLAPLHGGQGKPLCLDSC